MKNLSENVIGVVGATRLCEELSKLLFLTSLDLQLRYKIFP